MKFTLPNGKPTVCPAPSFSLQWEDKGVINTRQGQRHLFTATTPDGWWDFWTPNKDHLKSYGISCSKNERGAWTVACWLIPTETANAAPELTSAQVYPTQQINADYSKELVELSRSDKPIGSFAPIIPDGVTPYPYQIAGLQYALRRERVIIGDDMGLGKSLQAIMTCNHEKATNILVVCPASLRLNWKDEFEKFSTHPNPKFCPVLTKDDIGFIASCNIVFISYDIMASAAAQSALRSRKWDVIIADEAHYLKNKTTKRSVRLLGAPPRAKVAKGEPTTPIEAGKYLFLTGTPVSNRPEDFWNLLRFCAPKQFGVWTHYAMRYCNGKMVGYTLESSGASNLGELQEIVRGTCMVRRLKKHVLTQLPAKTRKIIALQAPDEVVRHINMLTLESQASPETLDEIKQRAMIAATAENASELQGIVESLRDASSIKFNECSKLRKEIGLAKVELALEHILNVLDETDSKLIIGAHHKEVIQLLEAGLQKFNPVVVTGSTDPSKRHLAVHEFQKNDRCRIFIGNIIAAGTGLTLTASPHVIIVEPDWVPANNAQFEDRAHRIGQSKPVLIEYLAMEKTIDIKILKANARKMDVIEQATDNRPEELQLASETQINTPHQPVNPNKTVGEKIAASDDRRVKHLAICNLGNSLSPREITVAHRCIQQIARYDSDNASAVNGKGFGKLDTETGKRLAQKPLRDLTNYEKGRVAILAWRYRKQCPQELTNQLKPIKK